MRTVVARNQSIQLINNDKPMIKPSYLLVKTKFSAISPGTELSMVKRSGEKEVKLGYSAFGIVEECGEHTEGFSPGDRVACYGAPYVEHSDYLLVPKTLCAKVPDAVSDAEASMGGIGAIAIHALRIAKLQFGEKIVVAGLGIIGQMIAQIADAAAYDVYALDIVHNRTKLLQSRKNIKCFSNSEEISHHLGKGADAVLLCTGGNDSELNAQSLSWARDKGKIVIVGDIEPCFPRNAMFAKEAEVLIARAGGPGRYDPVFEKEAIDYPYGFIRWTEGRNLAEYLRLVEEKRIDVSPYLKEIVGLESVSMAYRSLADKQSTILTHLISFQK
ncbi:zinc-dependent alcohol dehydrogenase [Bacillus testis]|uniref:zinc-dependent alcohol dehydrogenase n=1 Tax=Bacillus testis TaxID=1622072 RepID=UPI00067F152E|nr:zinc-binding alcohol dehydrogenase [Bacillus testis]